MSRSLRAFSYSHPAAVASGPSTASEPWDENRRVRNIQESEQKASRLSRSQSRTGATSGNNDKMQQYESTTPQITKECKQSRSPF
jgi:hypothetical protein